ncbi:MAG: heparin lyase I family protein [Candidatus Pedobacter colombiensis]|uniref:Heparin lyase I family protein n=1 Tax=Candidatus Pedobacter colombiensis TaxID=3121371 RepID=A0AAJ5W5Q9_9SPHI|nr:heparin lyase I family protein [Pedobacter sp.]WEK17459.1 MAG: heparin lyase I family protein [Pedobacter sp.]
MKNKLMIAVIFGCYAFLFSSCKKEKSSITEELSTSKATTSAVSPSGTVGILSVLWDGDANLGTGVFKTLNVDTPADLAAVNNATYGKIWRFTKAVGSNRCEVHAAKNFDAVEGDDIYLGWRSQLSMTSSVTTNALFQWKAYGANMTQNFPIVIKTVSGNFKLMHTASGGASTFIWSTPVSINNWNTFVLRIKVSRDAAVGFMEFWFNGVKQTLSNGTQRYYGRTLDADYCDPKWGVYGASSELIVNRVHALKIASTYAEVAP